ncbi:DNA-binding MarR family transcriptional regulator [Novosphingobium capsulatum]|uniref:DNA-binding MarR family transcriptional regulator n=1 Tax=Novosphingobium capsulatum TaxID=13688 RepID=A0ABU1MR62_9SPHN|nr:MULTISPECIES: MarR family transcriptional regulator [Novosphingobium]MDR6512830.1 DNA-binding MarR family transcriptional regulator [Novosphingobium capsulatum]
MTSRTPPPAAPAEPPRNAMDGVDEDAALLVDLLKLATFVSNPMRTGVAEPLDLAPTDLRIILALGGEGEMAGHELSEIMGVPPMNVSRALVALHQKGLVEPGEDLRNRRRKPFRLSAAGQAMFDRTVPAMAQVSRQLFADFNARDRAAFRRASGRLLARMTQWEGVSDG